MTFLRLLVGDRSGSQWGVIFAARGHLTVLGDIFDGCDWRVLMCESQDAVNLRQPAQHTPHGQEVPGPKWQWC